MLMRLLFPIAILSLLWGCGENWVGPITGADYSDPVQREQALNVWITQVRVIDQQYDFAQLESDHPARTAMLVACSSVTALLTYRKPDDPELAIDVLEACAEVNSALGESGELTE